MRRPDEMSPDQNAELSPLVATHTRSQWWLDSFFRGRGLSPTKLVARHDGTSELTWHVDDCDDRYVRATSSARGGDHVLVCRDLRAVESVVLGDRAEIFDWVSSHLVGLARSSLRLRPTPPESEQSPGPGEVALDVEGALRNLARAAEFVGRGEVRRAALYAEITLASLQSHLEGRSVVVRFEGPSREGVPL